MQQFDGKYFDKDVHQVSIAVAKYTHNICVYIIIIYTYKIYKLQVI